MDSLCSPGGFKREYRESTGSPQGVHRESIGSPQGLFGVPRDSCATCGGV